MAAIIRFPDGTEAKLVHPKGVWECADEDLRENLRLRTEYFVKFEMDYDPYPMHGVAQAIAAQVGAEVIHVDPQPRNEDDPPGMAY